MNRSGSVLSLFNFGALSDSAEGVTIDGNGIIYVVDEDPNLYVLARSHCPQPWLMVSGLIGLAGAGMRRKRSSQMRGAIDLRGLFTYLREARK